MGTLLKLGCGGRQVVVKVNDRGAGDGTMVRVLDLSRAAYAHLAGVPASTVTDRTANILQLTYRAGAARHGRRAGEPSVMRLFKALLLLACAPTAGALAADIEATDTSVARAAAAGPLTITEAGDGTGLRWAAWSERTASSGSVRLALFDARKTPAETVWSQAWADAYDPQLVVIAPWSHAGHPVYALTLQFGAEAQQVDLVSLDAAGKPSILVEKLGAAVGLVLEAEKAAVIVYQTPKAALVPNCFEWRDAAGKFAEIPCLH